MVQRVERFAEICVLIVCLGIIGLWFADRSPPIRGRSYTVVNAPTPGGDMLLRVTLERLRLCSAHVERYMTDSQDSEYLLPPFDITMTELGRDTYTRPISVPRSAAVGEAELRQVFVFACNPIHRVFWPIIETTTTRFRITPAD